MGSAHWQGILEWRLASLRRRLCGLLYFLNFVDRNAVREQSKDIMSLSMSMLNIIFDRVRKPVRKRKHLLAREVGVVGTGGMGFTFSDRRWPILTSEKGGWHGPPPDSPTPVTRKYVIAAGYNTTPNGFQRV